MRETKHTPEQPAAVDGPDSRAIGVEALRELDELEKARAVLREENWK